MYFSSAKAQLINDVNAILNDSNKFIGCGLQYESYILSRSKSSKYNTVSRRYEVFYKLCRDQLIHSKLNDYLNDIIVMHFIIHEYTLARLKNYKM